MVALSFEWVTTAETLDGLRDEWSRVADGSRHGGVFHSWEWQSTWWRTLGMDPSQRKRRRALRVLVARNAHSAHAVVPMSARAVVPMSVRAILPMYEEDAPVAGVVPRRRLRFLADGVVGSDYLGLIAHDRDLAAVAEPVARFLAVEAGERHLDLLELLDFLDGDPFSQALAEALPGEGFTDVARMRRYLCPVARLSGLDFPTYLAGRPQGFGSQLLKRRRRLSREPGFHLEIHETPDQVLEGLEALISLHGLRWSRAGGSQAFTSPLVARFHREVAPALARRGLVRMAVLSVRGSPIAAAYAFCHGGRLAYYQAGVDPDWLKRSAGTVVLGALIERAFGERLAEFDFLRGAEPYKALWAEEVRSTHALRAWPGTSRARRAARAERAVKAARRLLKTMIPPEVLAVARRCFSQADLVAARVRRLIPISAAG